MSRANPIDEILGKINAPASADEEQAARDELLTETTEPDTYRPYIIRARPQMGFTLVEAGGTLHGFMYHTLRHPKHQVKDGQELLSFTADGMAAVMQGRGLHVIYRALIRHTLAEAREFDKKPLSDNVTLIDRLGVKDTRELDDEARRMMG